MKRVVLVLLSLMLVFGCSRKEEAKEPVLENTNPVTLEAPKSLEEKPIPKEAPEPPHEETFVMPNVDLAGEEE